MSLRYTFPMGPVANRTLVLTMLGVPLIGLVVSIGALGVKRYRTDRFQRACLTGNEEKLQRDGYAPCAATPPAETLWYCDPRRPQGDRCEYRRDGRRLIVRFEPEG